MRVGAGDGDGHPCCDEDTRCIVLETAATVAATALQAVGQPVSCKSAAGCSSNQGVRVAKKAGATEGGHAQTRDHDQHHQYQQNQQQQQHRRNIPYIYICLFCLFFCFFYLGPSCPWSRSPSFSSSSMGGIIPCPRSRRYEKYDKYNEEVDKDEWATGKGSVRS